MTTGDIYEAESQSRSVIQNIVDTYYLVCLVDNDYVEQECALWTFLDKVGSAIIVYFKYCFCATDYVKMNNLYHFFSDHLTKRN